MSTKTTTDGVDYARLRYVLTGLGVERLGDLAADVRRWALDTPCPVPDKGVMRLGEMTTDDHDAVTGYLRTHKGRYLGEAA
jgi:hypothetical protein